MHGGNKWKAPMEPGYLALTHEGPGDLRVPQALFYIVWAKLQGQEQKKINCVKS